MRPLTVRLFGPLAELGSGREIVIHVSVDARVREAVDAAISHLPALADWKNRVAVADDDAYLRDDALLGDRAVICLIPPVSGG